MSVENPVIDYIDGPNRRIYLLAGVTTFHPVDDILKEVRYLRQTNENLRKFDMFVEGGGNILKQPGKYTPRYLILRLGTKLVWQSSSGTLNITGELFTDDPDDPDIFDLDLFALNARVFFNYTPPEAEVITVSSEGGGAAPTAAQNAQAVWTYNTRSLTTFGALVSDIASAIGSTYGDLVSLIWSNISRTLTARPPGTASDAIETPVIETHAVIAGNGTETVTVDNASAKTVRGEYGDVTLDRTLDKGTGNVTTTRS